MIVSVHQPQYIPWLGFFDKIARSDCFVFLDLAQYKPREFQNRNKIRCPDGGKWLSVPVISKGRGRQRICDVIIDNESAWRRQHLGTLKTCYAKAEFFDRYLPFFEELYAREWERLSDLNVHIIKYILGDLAISKPLYLESKLETSCKGTERIIEICQKLNADAYLSGLGGKEYLKEEKFVPAGIKLLYQDYLHPVYQQQFMQGESDFIPCLSIVDLLFNEGPRSREILKT